MSDDTPLNGTTLPEVIPQRIVIELAPDGRVHMAATVTTTARVFARGAYLLQQQWVKLDAQAERDEGPLLVRPTGLLR